MKKILLVFGILMLCSFTPQVGKNYSYLTDSYDNSINGKVVEVEGMRILILCKPGQHTVHTTINLTKDKLEVEKLKLEIEYLKTEIKKQ